MVYYDSPEYVKNIGALEKFNSVVEDYKSGIASGKNLSNKQKTILLNRYGMINKHVSFLRKLDQFELIDGVTQTIKKIGVSDYLCIVVTNQSL